MRHLGVCYKTAWLIKHKLMEVMREREDSRVLDGRVEIDDAYLGGERSGGKGGRGSENKVPFIAAVQTTPGWAARSSRPFALQPFTTEGVGAFARQVPGAVGHRRLRRPVVLSRRQDHRRRARTPVTGGGAASDQAPQFKAINTLLGNLKTTFTGTYHAFDFAKYAHRYLAEWSSTDPIAGSISPPSCLASFEALVLPRHGLRSSSGRLKFVASQEDVVRTMPQDPRLRV